ncbi:hypothetical protein P4647_25565 [Peribacillus frigoritolerans]|uniref:hypothetical protein n=1 Tax=Peribacillus frigoritolerans TaxID=450367 RepID=UPI002E1C32E2|nr:hypothetical protein [Peribacillus frigoritolerans]
MRSLTGAWLCDDGGAYFIRALAPPPLSTLPSQIIWLGLSQRGLGNDFTNVFFATPAVQGSDILFSGEWADVPRGRIKSSGWLTIRVEDNGGRLRAINKTGGFGGSFWTRL